MRNPRQSGTVAWFYEDKGWGMIKPDVEGAKVFVHFTQISISGFRVLKEGQRVSFEVEDTKKGPTALAVEVIPS